MHYLRRMYLPKGLVIFLMMVMILLSLLYVRVYSFRFGYIFPNLAIVELVSFILLIFLSIKLYLYNLQLNSDLKFDELTRVLSRREIYRKINEEIRRSNRTQHQLAVMIVDVDNFKLLNDTHGHLMGDQILKEISHIFTQLLREFDCVGRVGGDEFLMIFPETHLAEAKLIAERVRRSITTHNFLDYKGNKIDVTISVGVTIYTPEKDKVRAKVKLVDIMSCVDSALYHVKHNGRNHTHLLFH